MCVHVCSCVFICVAHVSCHHDFMCVHVCSCVFMCVHVCGACVMPQYHYFIRVNVCMTSVHVCGAVSIEAANDACEGESCHT